MQFAQVHRAFGHTLQWRAVELVQEGQRPLVHAVGHQQHFNALFLEHFQLRAVPGRSHRVGGDVVDGFLAVLHAGFVVGKAHADTFSGAGCKAQQLGDFVFVGEVFAQPFFQYRTKFSIELGVLACIGFGGSFFFGRQHIGHAICAVGAGQLVFAGHVFQHGQHAAGVAFADGLHIAAFLQQFTAHVQGQIGGIHHAFDPAQVRGHQRLGIVHDEHALDIQLDAGFFVPVPQVLRGFCRDVQQLRVLGAAFHAVVAPGQRSILVVADVFVEIGVLLVGDVLLAARPQGAGRVDGFPLVFFDVFAFLAVPLFFLHQHRQADVVGVFADHGLQLPVAQVFRRIVAQVQSHAGAANWAVDGFHLEVAGASADPAHAFSRWQASAAAFDGDFVGDDEARVEAHAKLANQLCVFLLVTAHAVHEFFGAAFGDGAQVVNRLLGAHADTVVGDGDGFGFFVE